MKTKEIFTGIYFIYAPNQNKIKIGRSKDIKVRFTQLRTGFMDKGKLLLAIKTNNEVVLEKKLHSKFDSLRVHGEWFLVTKDLVDFIENITKEYNDIVYFPDYHLLDKNHSFNSREVFEYYSKVKSIFVKTLIPTLFSVFGLIIGLYYYFLNPHTETMFLSYFFLIAFPIVTPLLAIQILHHQSVEVLKLFLALIFFTLLVEFVNLLVPIESGILFFFRGVTCVTALSFYKYAMIGILNRM